jgi:hypothetical protein
MKFELLIPIANPTREKARLLINTAGTKRPHNNHLIVCAQMGSFTARFIDTKDGSIYRTISAEQNAAELEEIYTSRAEYLARNTGTEYAVVPNSNPSAFVINHYSHFGDFNIRAIYERGEKPLLLIDAYRVGKSDAARAFVRKVGRQWLEKIDLTMHDHYVLPARAAFMYYHVDAETKTMTNVHGGIMSVLCDANKLPCKEVYLGKDEQINPVTWHFAMQRLYMEGLQNSQRRYNKVSTAIELNKAFFRDGLEKHNYKEFLPLYLKVYHSPHHFSVDEIKQTIAQTLAFNKINAVDDAQYQSALPNPEEPLELPHLLPPIHKADPQQDKLEPAIELTVLEQVPATPYIPPIVPEPETSFAPSALDDLDVASILGLPDAKRTRIANLAPPPSVGIEYSFRHFLPENWEDTGNA